MNPCYRRERHPPPPPLSVGGGGGSTTTVGTTPPAQLDMVFHPDSKFCSGASAGENSTASTDRCRTADLLVASFPLPGVTRRVDLLFPAGHIRRRGALTKRPKGARWLPTRSGRQSGSKFEFLLEPCVGLKVWPATAPPHSEEARTRTAPHNHSMRGPAPHRNLLYLGPHPHRTMENVGPH